jgi:hypothetical protein
VRLLAAVVEVVKVEAEGGPSHMGRLFDHPDPVVAVAAPVGCRDSRGSLAGCSRRVPISAFHPRSSQSGMSAGAGPWAEEAVRAPRLCRGVPYLWCVGC